MKYLLKNNDKDPGILYYYVEDTAWEGMNEQISTCVYRRIYSRIYQPLEKHAVVL